ncbi:hypothetical protein ACVILK_006644 [Bradyrhizobium embrapense]
MKIRPHNEQRPGLHPASFLLSQFQHSSFVIPGLRPAAHPGMTMWRGADPCYSAASVALSVG